MGKKKVAQVMQEAGAETFLAPVKASVPAPKSEVGTQEIKRADQLIKIQKQQIIASIQYRITEILNEIVKDVYSENKVAIVLEAILNIYDLQKRMNWLFEYKSADKNKRKELLTELLKSFFETKT